MIQAIRPTEITAILKTIGSEHPADTGSSLEAYIASLEANQQTMPFSKGNSSHDPVWLYWHGVKRQQNRRERALRKQRNYQ